MVTMSQGATRRQPPELSLGADHYVGLNGRRYHGQRASARSARAQANRADTVRPWLDGLGTVVDFGCGDGGVISRLRVARRIGIEVSEEAAAEAKARGVWVVPTFGALEDEIADAVLFCHSLEHLAAPSSALLEARRVLRPNGRLVALLPAETPAGADQRVWRPNHDRHFHSWTPLSIGNLLVACGFEVAVAQLQAPATRSRFVTAFGLTAGLRSMLVRWRARFLGNHEILAVATRPSGPLSPGTAEPSSADHRGD